MKKKLFYYLGIGFLLSFMWEISQSWLYMPHFQGVIDLILMHAKAAIGDVVMLLIVHIVMSLFDRNWKWVKNGKSFKYFIIAALGFVCALIVEKYALITGRRAYNDMMPIIPYLKVGLIPILQMMIIAPLSLFLISLSTVLNGKEEV